VREEARYPERDSGPAAVDGTHTHTLLEKCVQVFPAIGQFNDPESYIGAVLKDDDGEFTVDKDRAARVTVAIEYLEKRLAEREAAGYFPEVLSEQRVYPDTLVHRDDMSGTVDVQIIDSDMIEIVDYKDGMSPVDAERNPQLEQYAVGAYCGLINSDKTVNPLMKIKMTIIQPKLALKGMPAVSSWECTLGELMIAKERMIAEGEATDAPDAPLVPGEVQCKYCAHKGACSALAGKSMADAGVVFQNLTVSTPGLDVAHDTAKRDPAVMDDAKLVEVMEAAPLLRGFLDSVEDELQRRLNAGKVIAGVKMVKGRGTRAWAFPEAEMAAKLKKFGVPKEHIYESKMISPAKAEKLSWTAKDGSIMSLSDKQVVLLKKEYVTTVEGKPVVALDSDPRPAIVQAAALFGVVDQSADVPSWLS
jgi:hypothetical protein